MRVLRILCSAVVLVVLAATLSMSGPGATAADAATPRGVSDEKISQKGSGKNRKLSITADVYVGPCNEVFIDCEIELKIQRTNCGSRVYWETGWKGYDHEKIKDHTFYRNGKRHGTYCFNLMARPVYYGYGTEKISASASIKIVSVAGSYQGQKTFRMEGPTYTSEMEVRYKRVKGKKYRKFWFNHDEDVERSRELP